MSIANSIMKDLLRDIVPVHNLHVGFTPTVKTCIHKLRSDKKTSIPFCLQMLHCPVERDIILFVCYQVNLIVHPEELVTKGHSVNNIRLWCTQTNLTKYAIRSLNML